MIYIRDDAPAGLIIMEAIGRVSKEDYQSIVIPELERAFAVAEKVRFLYLLGERFEGFEAAALWDDARLGLKHLGDFARIAVVCDVTWVQHAVRLIGFITPCPVKVFQQTEEAAAIRWLQS